MRKILRLSLSVVTLALVAALSAPVLIDKGALRYALSEQLTTALGQTVVIEQLGAQFFPTASIHLIGVQTAFDDRPDSRLKVGRISIELSWRALLRGKITVRRLSIETLDLNPVLFSHLRRFSGGPASATADKDLNIRLQGVQLSGVTWVADNNRRLGPFAATLIWDQGLRPSRIEISQDDGGLQAVLLPNADAIEFNLEANDWTVPLERPIAITRLQIRGRYHDNGIEIFKAGLEHPDGRLQIAGPITWSPHWRIGAKLSAQQVNLSTLMPALGLPSVPGVVEGDCRLSAEAPAAQTLLRRPAIDCELRYSQGGTSSDVTFRTTPAGDDIAYVLNASDLLFPVGPPLFFATVSAHGKFDEQRLRIETARFQGYNGDVEAQAEITWAPQWRIVFEAKSRGVRLAPLLAVFQKRSLDGTLVSRCKGTLKGAEFSGLLAQPDVNCHFNIIEGEIYDADLERAANLLKTGPTGRGSTPFDRLRGQLHLKQEAARFSGLQLHSKVLEATGGLTVDDQNKLDGELSVGLKNTAGVVSVPLLVEGSVTDPVIRPTTSAMAGGAAGTLLLGPGLGTAVGVKVGEVFQKATSWFKPKDDPSTPDDGEVD